jgi:AcrR family transcriptional regulator
MGGDMPKQTLFNLPETKREKIIKAGIDEFSEKGYGKASINTIVANAGIPKGSFYQYFSDKKDMFIYICGLAGSEKLKYISAILTEISKISFFDVYKKMYIAGIQFGKDHPEYFRISNDILKDSELRTEIFGLQAGSSDDFFMDFLKSGIEKGDIREDIDVGFVSSMLTSLSLAMGEYCIKKYDNLDLDELEVYADKFIEMIKNGIAEGNRK